jgi:hypothetical protein
MKMEAKYLSETLVHCQRAIWLYIPEASSYKILCRFELFTAVTTNSDMIWNTTLSIKFRDLDKCWAIPEKGVFYRLSLQTLWTKVYKAVKCVNVRLRFVRKCWSYLQVRGVSKRSFNKRKYTAKCPVTFPSFQWENGIPRGVSRCIILFLIGSLA